MILKLAKKLKTDVDFYNECSKNAKENYTKHYSENIFVQYMEGILNESN